MGIAGRWSHPKFGNLLVVLEDKKLTATGSYDKPINALPIMLGNQSISIPATTEQIRVVIEGRITGRTAECELTLSGEVSATRSLLDDLNTKNLLMYLSDDEHKLFVLENPFESNPLLYELRKFRGR